MTDHPTAKQWARERAELRERLVREEPHSYQEGATYTCPACARKALAGSRSLRRRLEAPGYVLEAVNLHGAECGSCGHSVLETFEEILLEEEAQHMWRSHYTASVSRVGGQKLGMYFPRDVIESMSLHAKDVLAVRVLDEDTFVVHRRHAPSETS